MRKALNAHRVEAGLFGLAIAALGLGVSLVAQPGDGLWGTIGWVSAIVGLLCLVLSALLWSPTASLFGRFSFKRRRQIASARLIIDEIVLTIDEGRELQGNAFSGQAPWHVLKGWEDLVALFIETVLGAAERQRFLDAGLESTDDGSRLAGLLGWLRNRRDQTEGWSPLPDADVSRAIAVRREARANLGAIDTPEIEVELAPLGALIRDRSTVFELGVRNCGAVELHDVLLRFEVPDSFPLERTTRSGESEGGGQIEEEEERRRWSGQIGPLAASAIQTLHFSVLPMDASEFQILVKVRVAARPWLVHRFSLLVEEPPPTPTRPRTKGGGRRRATSLDGDRAALDKLYVEGRRMQKAAEPFAQVTAAGFFYGPPPSEGEVERWEGRVRAALPHEYRRRFKFGPLDARAGDAILRALNPLPESRASRRIKGSMEELQRIIEELDEADER